MNEDSRLFESFRNGDEGAFGQLVAKYRLLVFNTACSIIGNIQESDDIAQEVFLKVYCSKDSFKFKSSFSTWLYRIAVNKCLDELRRRKRKKVLIESELNDQELFRLKNVLERSNENIESDMMRKEMQGTLQKMLNLLPEKYRVILVLKEMEGMSYNEISEVLNISINKVKIWLFRARSKIKEKLEKAGIHELQGN